jgi:predicted membrane GTPase involved in stress response
MNELVEAWLRGKDNGITKVYRHSPDKMGVWVNETNGKEYIQIVGKGEAAGDINLIDMMVHKMQHEGFELLITERQVKEREFGNAYEAYETTEFKNGKVVKHYAGPSCYTTPAEIRKAFTQ